MSAHCCVDRSDQQTVNVSVTQSVSQEGGYRVARTAKNTAYRKYRKELARSASNDLPRLFRSDARSECTSASFSLALQNHNMIILQIWGRQLSEIIKHIQDKGSTFLKCVVSIYGRKSAERTEPDFDVIFLFFFQRPFQDGLELCCRKNLQSF